MTEQGADYGNGDTILLSTAEATQIARFLRMLVPNGGKLDTMLRSAEAVPEIEATDSSHDYEKLRDIARRIYIRRNRRARFFPGDYFREPAWDMLLALYATSNEEARQRVSGLVTYASVPQTTALRYLTCMEQHGLIHRHACAKDGRVIFVELSQVGHASMTRYLASMLESGNL